MDTGTLPVVQEWASLIRDVGVIVGLPIFIGVGVKLFELQHKAAEAQIKADEAQIKVVGLERRGSAALLGQDFAGAKIRISSPRAGSSRLRPIPIADTSKSAATWLGVGPACRPG